MNQPLVDHSTAEWEAQLGRAVRRLRLGQQRSQEDLADAANVSLSALKNLEAGRGSTLRTLILVARTLGREDWLASLAPAASSVSPMQLLRDRERQAGKVRQRAPRRQPGAARS